MSADLFAEFASDTNNNQSNQQSVHPKSAPPPLPTTDLFEGLAGSSTLSTEQGRSPWSQSQPQASTTDFSTPSATDDHDDWGDFEGSSTVVPINAVNSDPFKIGATQPPPHPQQSWTHNSVPSNTFSIEATSVYRPSSPQWQSAPIVKAKASADPTVLFDAEDDFDDDDDFGDFEGTTTAPTPTTSKPTSELVDLLGDTTLAEANPATTNRQRQDNPLTSIKTATKPKQNLVGGFGDTKKAVRASAAASPAALKDDDAWDTFDDWEASIPGKTPKGAKAKPKALDEGRTSTTSRPETESTFDEPQPGELPPTNVPPPGVLLSLFPTLFAEAQEKLFKPMAAQTLPMRNKLMAEPATISYLRGYLMLANVAAHIIAGRKLRWKRDQHLSQGMRIGPASSRATSGMKLTGIDKGENMKEEREVSDVVRVWKEQIGRLRHIVSGTNQIKAGTLGAVPDLHEAMLVKSLKQSEGGVPARQACMLCGLKREERVTATDLAVDDSFGEWWVDQVGMHRICRNFWQQHKETLRQR